MSYLENVQNLCNELGIANPIEEESLQVASVRFEISGQWEEIPGTEMNRAGRLFFQTFFPRSDLVNPKDTHRNTSIVKYMAAIFFAEKWQDAETAGRPMLTALKAATKFRIFWK